MAGPETGILVYENACRLLKTYRWEPCILERNALTGFRGQAASPVPKKIIGQRKIFGASCTG